MAEKRDFYEVLGVEKDATQKQVKDAYRRLARKLHPDVNPDPGAADQFKEVGSAYEVLSDTEKRATYDRFGHSAFQGGGQGPGGFGGGATINMEDLFGGGGGGAGGGAGGGGSPAAGNGHRTTRPRAGGQGSGAGAEFTCEVDLSEGTLFGVAAETSAYTNCISKVEARRAECLGAANGDSSVEAVCNAACDRKIQEVCNKLGGGIELNDSPSGSGD